jgi:hypothetical protein
MLLADVSPRFSEKENMIRRTAKTLLLASALAVLAWAAPAQAGMIPVQVSVTPDGGNFRWTYAVVVTTDVKVNPGDSFTIYDFSGLVNGSISAPSGWSSAVANLSPRAGTSPHDDPSLPDVTFTYSGSSPISGQQGLGNFMVDSTVQTSGPTDFTSTTHRQVDGRVETNITTTDTPTGSTNQVSGTPEPSTIALLGLSLPLLGAYRALRRRKNG